MLVWNSRPQDETVYLGENLRQLDLWGRACSVGTAPGGRVIHVERLPSFVEGLSARRWPAGNWPSPGRAQIPAIPGRPHTNSYFVKNTFAEPVDVRVKLIVPEGWRVEPAEISLHLPGGAESRQTVSITLSDIALSGWQKVTRRV